jgi:hypothetical protein
VLLVLSKIAETEGLTVPDEDVEAEVQRARDRYGSDRKLVGYFESERGRAAIRSSIRRTRLVEGMVDQWLAAHPEFGPLPHLEDVAGSVVAGAVPAGAAVSDEATAAG